MYSDVTPEEKVVKKHEFFRRRTKRLIPSSEKQITVFFQVFILYSLMFLLYGICSVVGVSFSNSLLKVLGAFLFLLYGIIHFYFFHKKASFSFYKHSIIYGIFSCLLGLICFWISSEQTHQILVVLGLYFILVSLEHGIQGFGLVRAHDKDVFIFFVSLLLFWFMAVLLFVNPFLNLYFGEVIGVFSIFFGILNITFLSFLKKKEEIILSFYDWYGINFREM